MGIRLFGSNCGCGSGGCNETATVKVPNPNPKNFRINAIQEVGRYVVAEITYYDCTNFEGRKILVFEDVDIIQISQADEIDPHFCDGKHISPIVRFRPDRWDDAIRFCNK